MKEETEQVLLWFLAFGIVIEILLLITGTILFARYTATF